MNENKIVKIVTIVCQLSKDFMEQEELHSWESMGILRSEKSKKAKTKLLYECLMGALSYQGIGDMVVNSYRAEHGDVSYFQIARRLKKARRESHGKLCARLRSFESFTSCGYKKTQPICNNPRMLNRCPLPSHDLLKGVLNIKAYSFFFYIRDICQGDLLTHFDQIIGKHVKTSNPDPTAVIGARDDLITDFKQIFGVGDKLSSMTLSAFLLANQNNKAYVKVGQSMIAVDTLVHNFLHRTGILKFYDCQHNYGPGCSIDCVSIIDSLTKKIDARQFNKAHPKYFPRFVQFSIWHFCSVIQENICNGVNINDGKPCNQEDCPVYQLCDHITLKKGVNNGEIPND